MVGAEALEGKASAVVTTARERSGSCARYRPGSSEPRRQSCRVAGRHYRDLSAGVRRGRRPTYRAAVPGPSRATASATNPSSSATPRSTRPPQPRTCVPRAAHTEAPCQSIATTGSSPDPRVVPRRQRGHVTGPGLDLRPVRHDDVDQAGQLVLLVRRLAQFHPGHRLGVLGPPPVGLNGDPTDLGAPGRVEQFQPPILPFRISSSSWNAMCS